MTQVLQGLPGIVCYIDEILVTDCTRTEHKKNLSNVLDQLRHYGLYFKRSKCSFLEFLGHSISSDGIEE